VRRVRLLLLSLVSVLVLAVPAAAGVYKTGFFGGKATSPEPVGRPGVITFTVDKHFVRHVRVRLFFHCTSATGHVFPYHVGQFVAYTQARIHLRGTGSTRRGTFSDAYPDSPDKERQVGVHLKISGELKGTHASGRLTEVRGRTNDVPSDPFIPIKFRPSGSVVCKAPDRRWQGTISTSGTPPPRR
jgi:hypothetical protein